MHLRRLIVVAVVVAAKAYSLIRAKLAAAKDTVKPAALLLALAGGPLAAGCQPAQPQRPVVFTCPACGGVNSHKCPHCHGYPHEPARWHW